MENHQRLEVTVTKHIYGFIAGLFVASVIVAINTKFIPPLIYLAGVALVAGVAYYFGTKEKTP